MFLQIHPTRSEALTASETTLTRWSLTTNPATILTQISTAPGAVFNFIVDPGGRVQTCGGLACTPDGELFALQQPHPSNGPCMIEWRRWDDLLPARTVIFSQTAYTIISMASSPNGRWLVIDNCDLFLLDWHTGEVISHHFWSRDTMSGLAFDPTSTFVAGLSSGQGGGSLGLWRLDPAEQFVPRQGQVKKKGPFHNLDYVHGSVALTLVHENLDRTGISWNQGDLADTTCVTAFSPDSRTVVFSFNSSYSQCSLELVAYEVPSGKRLWCARSEQEGSGAFAFSPDSRLLLVPVQGSELLLYSAQDGALLQRLQPEGDEPVQALAFDHDGTTLWLAGKTALWHYQTQR